MTNDFVDDLTQACQKEGVPYLIIIGARDGKAAQVFSDLEHWQTGNNQTPKEDIKQLLDVIELDGDNES